MNGFTPAGGASGASRRRVEDEVLGRMARRSPVCRAGSGVSGGRGGTRGQSGLSGPHGSRGEAEAGRAEDGQKRRAK